MNEGKFMMKLINKKKNKFIQITIFLLSYIYIEREREKKKERCKYRQVNLFCKSHKHGI